MFGNGQPIVDRCELSAGNDWPDFNLVAVGQDLIFRDEFITPYDQMRLHDEIEFSQQVLGAFRSFDFDLSVPGDSVERACATIRLLRAEL